MDKMIVRWSKNAIDQSTIIHNWYLKQMGEKAARKFAEGIMKGLFRLKSMPCIGRVEESLSDDKVTFRSIIEHRDYKIIYYIEDDIIHISAIWSCRQNPRHLSSL